MNARLRLAGVVNAPSVRRFLKSRWPIALIFLVLLTWWVGASWRYNIQIDQRDWRSDLRADAAGYYIYLPAAFRYSFRSSGIEDSTRIGEATGYLLDRQNDRIVTKYTYGVALLELPFFLIAEAFVGPGSTDGFTETHRRALELAGIFYWLTGLVLLGTALWRWMPVGFWPIMAVLAMISFGSNVFYYAFRMPGFAHIHSFFLVCLAIATMPVSTKRARDALIFHVACALIILVRPTDALIVVFLYAWLRSKGGSITSSMLSCQVLVGCLLIVPQLAYWNFAYGDWIHYSYGQETFSEWSSPHVIEFLFAAQNGWLPYAPALLLVPVGGLLLYRKEPQLFWLCTSVLVLAVYISTSWFTWRYGCSFGARPMVQYMPVIAVFLWMFMGAEGSVIKQLRTALLPIVTLLCFINYRAALQYSGCINGDEVWNWQIYVDNIVHAFL